MYKFYYLEDMTQEDLNKLALERNDLEKENQQLKKQKDDVVEYLNSIVFEESFTFVRERAEVKYNLLRMLGETDVED